MTLSRRELLGTGVAFALGERSFAQAAPRVRRDIAGLKANAPDIEALAAGIKAMRAKPPNDPLNWKNFAERHGRLDSRVTTDCQHGSWFFLPWHRAYVHRFEQAIAELSGHKAFALPFWAWERDFAMPKLFDAGGVPEFDNPTRAGKPNAGRKNPKAFPQAIVKTKFSKRALELLLNSPDFATFAGGDPDDKIVGAFAGALENNQHRYIHEWVDGDMGEAGCPFDPIFWLHHSNVDRLWDAWARINPKRHPAAKSWLDKTFPSVSPDATKPLRVRDLLGDQLGYIYEGTRAAGDMSPVSATSKTSIGLQAPSGAWTRMTEGDLAATPRAAKNAGALFASALDERGTSRVRLRLRKLNPKADPRAILEVYLAIDAKPIKPDPEGPAFAGSVSVAERWMSADEHGHGPGGVALDVTLPFRELTRPLNGKLPPDMTVRFVPRTVGGESWRGEWKDLVPTEVTFDVVQPGE